MLNIPCFWLSSNASCQICLSDPDIGWWQFTVSDYRLKGGIIKNYFLVIYFLQENDQVFSLLAIFFCKKIASL